jgi:rod shape-determining protein MreD
MEDLEIRVGEEPRIEVHQYATVVVVATVAAALILQAFLPVHFHWAKMFDLPLLVTLYFALSRRNPSSGLLLGMIIGLLQDSLSHTSIGAYGIAKTLVGFFASSLGSRIEVDHPLSRFLLTIAFCLFHNGVVLLIDRLLLGQHGRYFTLPLLLGALVNAGLAVFLFALLDRLRKR